MISREPLGRGGSQSFAPKSASSGDPNDKTYDKVCNILEKDLRQVCTSLRLQINLSFYLAFAPSAMQIREWPVGSGISAFSRALPIFLYVEPFA